MTDGSNVVVATVLLIIAYSPESSRNTMLNVAPFTSGHEYKKHQAVSTNESKNTLSVETKKAPGIMIHVITSGLNG